MSDPKQEIVRYYEFDGNLADAYLSERLKEFREVKKMFDVKELTTDQLLELKAVLFMEIFKRLGS